MGEWGNATLQVLCALPLLPHISLFLTRGCKRLLCFQGQWGEKWKGWGLFINVFEVNAFSEVPFSASLCRRLHTPSDTKNLQNSFFPRNHIYSLWTQKTRQLQEANKLPWRLIRAVSSCFPVMWQVTAWTTAWLRRARATTTTRTKRRNTTRREGFFLRWPPTSWERGSSNT